MYIWSVSEDIEVNTVIGVVEAGDKENDTVIFSITNSTNSEGMMYYQYAAANTVSSQRAADLYCGVMFGKV